MYNMKIYPIFYLQLMVVFPPKENPNILSEFGYNEATEEPVEITVNNILV